MTNDQAIPTVLVLGAGASTHCGYPLGSVLRSIICSLNADSIANFVCGKWSSDQIRRFIHSFARAGFGSIDAYLEHFPEEMALGKFLIAWCLKERESLDGLFPNSYWYEHIGGSICPSTTEPDFSENKLRVITFNYDRSLECYLFERLKARCRLSPGRAAKVLSGLPILHVHGILGAFPEVPYNTERKYPELLTISEQVRIVSEIAEDHDNEPPTVEFSIAREWLREAERIYFLGFGFLPTNLNRFQFFGTPEAKGKIIKGTRNGIFREIDLQNLRDTLLSCSLVPEEFYNNDCDEFFRTYARL